MFSVELFPPGWLGRSFQLLALSIDPGLVNSVGSTAAVFNSFDDYRRLVVEAWELAEQLLEEGLAHPPRFYGNDGKPLRSVIGERVSGWREATHRLVEHLENGKIAETARQSLTAAVIMKLNTFEYMRRMAGFERTGSVGQKINVHGYLLALIGGILSKLGRIDDKGFYILPHPEASILDLDGVGRLYMVLSLTSAGDLPPFGRVLRYSVNVRKLPVSIDVLVLLYGAALVAELLEAEPGEACGAPELDLLYAAVVSEARNRAILNSLFPLGFSEPICMLGSRPLTKMASAMARAIERGSLCRVLREGDTGFRAVGHCIQKLYLYTVTSNNIYLYDCTRMLRGAAESNDCQQLRGLLTSLAASLAQSVSKGVVVGG